ncbi:hypothetical protein [Paraclostridium dentum]|uniref:hypothetical protein n=1 Tax=Paraclostridium dentum TaxID=2662455 RepID=UPI003F3E833A
MNDLNIIHTSNNSVWEVDLFENLTYTIVIYNISEKPLEYLNIEVNIPKETEYIKNSCTLNGSRHEYSQSGKILVPKLYPKENLIITLDVKMKDSSWPCSVDSFVKVDYAKKTATSITSFEEGSSSLPTAYVEDTSLTVENFIFCSEMLNTPVIFRNITIYHEINKYTILLGDVLEYKFLIQNNSSLCADEVFLEIISNASVDFDSNSLYINGTPIKNTNLSSGVYIGHMAPKQSVLVTFRGHLKKLSNLNAMYSRGSLSFIYSQDLNYKSSPSSTESNEVVVELAPNLTKSINISKTVCIPSCNPKIMQISDIFNYGAKVISKNFLENSNGDSFQNTYTNAKNIFIGGYVDGRVTYYSSANTGLTESNMYIIEYEIPFKTDVLIPECFNEFVDIDVRVHFADATLLDDERVYINVILDINFINN